jgi:osmotically-inducible protein OsmY
MSRKYAHFSFLLTAVVAAGVAVQITPAQTAPDNTRVNKQDSPTADSQKDNHTDRYLTQQIRKAVMADKSLSSYAHNVKIISQAGTVTLKGPVRSEDEKKSIVAKAEQIAGPDKVTDQLTVKEKQ